MSSALEFYFSEIYKRQRKNQEKIRRHAKITAARLTFQITRGKGGKEKSQPQRRLFLSAESALKSCLDFAPFTPFVSFIRKIFPPVSPSAFSVPYSVKLLRDGLDGAKMVVKGNFVERVCSFLPIPSEARYIMLAKNFHDHDSIDLVSKI